MQKALKTFELAIKRESTHAIIDVTRQAFHQLFSRSEGVKL